MQTRTMTVAAAALAASLSAFAEIKLVSPAEGEVVQLLPARQKEIMALATPVERCDALHEDRVAKREREKAGKESQEPKVWRVSAPLTLKWRASAGEKGPWLVRVAKTREAVENPAAPCALELSLNGDGDTGKVKVEKSRDGSLKISYAAEGANLEVGERYYWKVWSSVKCPHFDCSTPTFDGKCKCGKTKIGPVSPVGSFLTDPSAPRWISVEGRVKNFRDLGGWPTEFGRRVRQGRVYRGQGLNDNSFCGMKPGRNRLMVADVAYLKGVLGIKTDLDLRSGRETAMMTTSPLGEGVNFVHHSSDCYKGIFEDTEKGKNTMAENFRLFTDEANYPIFFHCIAGADRTGSLAYVLNGICGVSKHDLEVDWESTFYPTVHGAKDEGKKEKDKDWRGSHWFDEGFAKYGDAKSTLRERIELYLIDCGVTREEIEKVRELMLEPAGK